jgi:hypothetical protein
MSYATVQDVLFALALDRCRVAESVEPTPRRPRGRTRISGSRAQSSGQAQGSRPDESRRAAQSKAISSCSYYPNGFMVPSWHHQQRG